jgi:hypothetical protein
LAETLLGIETKVRVEAGKKLNGSTLAETLLGIETQSIQAGSEQALGFHFG